MIKQRKWSWIKWCINYKELKESTGATGDDDIYEVTNEYDNRKVLTSKIKCKI